jgi:hypothetical protein
MPDDPTPDWSLKSVNAPDALSKPDDPVNWGNIKVAHIDTGVTEHPCLGNWVDVDSGVNYMDPIKKPIDPLDKTRFSGHGTRTLSVLTGYEDGIFSGVAPKLPTVPYRVTDTVLLDGNDERLNVAKAIHHAIDENKCQIISISLGWPTMKNSILGDAVDYAYDNGVILVAAGGQEINSACYPGKYFRAIGVGGYTNEHRIFEDYENMNNYMDIWAPAKYVYHAKVAAPANSLQYEFGKGTSFATPHVAAAAAMWLLRHGDAINNRYGSELWKRVEAFRMVLKLSALDINSWTGFDDIKPPRNIAEAKPKRWQLGPHGFDTLKTGGLNIAAMLNIALPAAAAFESPASEASIQYG